MNNTLTDIYESPNFNPEHYDHWMSVPFMKPSPSKNILIRIMDLFCGVLPETPSVTIWILLLVGFTIFWTLLVFTDAFFTLDIVLHKNEDIDVQLLVIVCLIFSQFLRFDLVYRHYRNKYIRKRLLPGPNGWCSIDFGHPYITK